MEELFESTNFPWLLTNVTYLNGEQIANTKQFVVFEHQNIRV